MGATVMLMMRPVRSKAEGERERGHIGVVRGRDDIYAKKSVALQYSDLTDMITIK